LYVADRHEAEITFRHAENGSALKRRPFQSSFLPQGAEIMVSYGGVIVFVGQIIDSMSHNLIRT
jgi:hypothetical protein